MGAVDDAVQAVLADANLTQVQKRVEIQHIRANAMNTVLTNHMPFTWSQGVWTATISAATVGVTPAGYAISLTIAVTKSGVDQPLNNPFVFVNPPTLVADPAGTITRTATLPVYQGGGTVTRTFREDVVAALKQAVLAALIDALRG